MRALFLSLLLIFGSFPVPVEAQHNIFIGVVSHTAVAPSNCPFGTVAPADNGCSGAPLLQAGSMGIQLTGGRSPGGMLNQLVALTTDYSATANPENYAGIDYGIGQYTPYTSLDATPDIDIPALYPFSGGTGCTYSSSGDGGDGTSPHIDCTPASGQTMTIDSFDFTKGGTTCIPFAVHGNLGTLIFSNNYAKNLTGNCIISSSAPTMFNTPNRTTATTEMISNTLDANRSQYPFAIGGCTPSWRLVCNPIFAFLVAGNFVVKYNYFVGFTQRPLQWLGLDPASPPVAGIDYEFNLFVGGCSENTNSHCELPLVQAGATITQGAGFQTWNSNTFIVPTDHHTNGPSLFPTTLGGTPISYTPTYSLSHNFIAVGPSGGATIPNTQLSASLVGSTLTLTAISTAGVPGVGTFGSGQLLSGGSGNDTIQVMAVYDGRTGQTPAGPGGGGYGGVGSTWSVQWESSSMTAKIDDGNGGGVAGNVLTVTTDSTLSIVASATTGHGTEFLFAGIRQVVGSATTGATCGPSACTGAGGTGTYLVNGAAVSQASTGVGAEPPDTRPGMWTVPGTKTFGPSFSVVNGVYPANTAGPQVHTLYGQVTLQNNSWDLSAFNGGSATGVWAQWDSSATKNFVGSISGTTLTYSSGTTPVIGQGLLTTGGVSPGTYIVSGSSPTFTVSQSQTVGSTGSPVALQDVETVCVNTTVFGSNVDMSGINGTSVMNSYGTSANLLSGCGP